MEDIKVTSKIDLKTYFRIGLVSYFKLRGIIIIFIALIVVSYYLMNDPAFRWWEEFGVISFILVVYGGLVPLRIYFSCARNMKKVPYLLEAQHYTINSEKIEHKGETTSNSGNWQYVTKLVERENYFLLMTANRSFHFLPKAGFESNEEIARFKNMVREKGIKMSYN